MARHLDSNEKALWGKVVATVSPIPVTKPKAQPVIAAASDKALLAKHLNAKPKPVRAEPAKIATAAQSKIAPVPHNLDGHWDRRITRGSIMPDVSVDLHDASLSGAYARLDGALEQAIAQRMKVVGFIRIGCRLPVDKPRKANGAMATKSDRCKDAATIPPTP